MDTIRTNFPIAVMPLNCLQQSKTFMKQVELFVLSFFVDSYMISWAGLAGVETAVLLNQSLVQ